MQFSNDFLKNKYTNSLFPAKLLWAKCKVVPIKQKMSSKKNATMKPEVIKILRGNPTTKTIENEAT
jgi:hypothetical protein